MTGRDGRRPWHTIGRTEALTAALATFLVTVIDQLGPAIRIDAPEGAFSRLILRARYLDEIPTIEEFLISSPISNFHLNR